MAINKSSLSEVTFYACTTRDEFEKENSKDSGGLYILRDGLGIYRGREAVAGPAPIQIIAKGSDAQAANARSNLPYIKYECSYDCELSFTRLNRHLKGPGNRAVRFVDLDNKVIELYAVSYSSVTKSYVLCNTYTGLSYRLAEDNSTAFEIESVTYRVSLYSDKLIVEKSSSRIPTIALLTDSLNELSKSISDLSDEHSRDIEDISDTIDSINNTLTSVSNALSGYVDEESGEAVPGLLAKVSGLQSWVTEFKSAYSVYKDSVDTKFRELADDLSDHSDKLDDLEDAASAVDEILNGNEQDSGLINTVAEIKDQLYWDVRIPDTNDPEPVE